jgi:hypothetical protein
MIDADFYLRSPVNESFNVPTTVWSTLIEYLRLIYVDNIQSEVDTELLKQNLPKRMERWGKAEIAKAGDKMSASSDNARKRDASFIRVRA